MEDATLINAEANREVFDSVAGSYTQLDLKPAEQAVLTRFGDRIGQMEMLDLGVGAGRTGYSFAPLVKRYVGLDYSPRMLERAGELLGDSAELVLGDARDLSTVAGPFDFVLFSFNGIDAVGHEDRLAILREVRRVLKPNGHFLFSSHSTGALPLSERKERSERYAKSRLAIPYEVYARLRDVGYRRRIRAINAGLDLETAHRRGWTVVRGFGQEFRLEDYYVDPAHQVEQLRQVGLELVTAYDLSGNEVELPHAGRGPWLDYLCRPVVAATDDAVA